MSSRRYVFALCRGGGGRPAASPSPAWRSGRSLNAFVVYQRLRATCPCVSLALGFAGAFAVVAVASLIARTRSRRSPSRWLGEHSIVIYLAFFLPMAVSRAILLKTGIVPDIGTVSLLVTLSGIVGPILLYAMIQWTGYGRFLFERPAWATLDVRPRPRREGLVAAE